MSLSRLENMKALSRMLSIRGENLMRNFLKRISDIKNAMRVLEIMDAAGCDIEKVTREGFADGNYWQIKPKWYVAEKEAKDLQKIISFKENYYGNHHRFWKIWFRNIREGYRYL